MGTGKLLIVDDDEDLLAVLRRRFRARGYEVSTAVDGDVALGLCEKKRPDIVLLDLHMPRLDGLAVLRAIREHYPATHVVIMSGDIYPRRAAATLAEGARDYVSKPVDAATLEAVVSAAMAGRKLNGSLSG